MSMRIVFLKDFDGYKKDQDCYVERSLAKRYCEKEIAVPGMVWDDMQKPFHPKVEVEVAPLEDDAIDTEPEPEDEAGDTEPEPDPKALKEEAESKEETAESKPTKTRTKSTKKAGAKK